MRLCEGCKKKLIRHILDNGKLENLKRFLERPTCGVICGQLLAARKKRESSKKKKKELPEALVKQIKGFQLFNFGR